MAYAGFIARNCMCKQFLAINPCAVNPAYICKPEGSEQSFFY